MFSKKFILKKNNLKKYQLVRRFENKFSPVCLAPFKCLRFLPNGNITVCCHNNSYVLGRYPQNSVKEVWEGDKLKKLRKSISKADFSLGCQVCLDAFESGAFESVNPLLYEDFDENKDQPVILDFKIATECNLECIMCSEYSSSAIRGNNYFVFENLYDESFIFKIKEFLPGIKAARFSGGEPFLNKIYYELWDLIISINPDCEIFIQTNGTILNKKIKNLLEKGKFFINVSVDAINAKNYSKIRVNGDFDKLKSNIEFFSEYSLKYSRKFGITTCAMKDNIYEWTDILQFANHYNAEIWFSEVFFPFENALWCQDANFLKEAFEFLKTKKISNSDNSKTAVKNILVFNNLLKRLEVLILEIEKREKSSKNFITNEILLKKIKKYSKNLMVDNLQNIEKAILESGDQKILDFSLVFNKFYSINYLLEYLSGINKDVLVKNFRFLRKNII